MESPSDNAIDYRKLPGRSSGLASYNRLYLGPDHILQVTSMGFSEAYQRFFFKDIQCFTTRKSMRGFIFTLLLGVPTTLFLLGMISGPTETSGVWFVFMLLFGIPLVVNLVKGTTCMTYVQTATGAHRITALGRIPAFRKFLTRVTPLIEQAQSQVQPQGSPPGPVDTQPEGSAPSPGLTAGEDSEASPGNAAP